MSRIRKSTFQNNSHSKKSNKMQQCIRIYYSIFIWSSLCFGRHTAHHQEPKTALAASGFAYMWGCWVCGCWTASSNHTSNNPTRMQNQRLLVQFRLLMMGGVSPETCWASYKYGIINSDTLLHLVGFFAVWVVLWRTDPRTSSFQNNFFFFSLFVVHMCAH